MKVLSSLFILIAAICLLTKTGFSDSVENVAGAPEREAVAISFAKQHHPELAGLLEQLKEMDHKGYQAAITELFRTSERLAKYKERMPDRYNTELALWKLDSRIRLLAARSAKGMDDSVRDQIRELLLERNQIRIAQLESDRDKLNARLIKLNDSIKDMKSRRDEIVERDLERLVKSVKSVKNRTPAKKPKTTTTQPAATSKKNSQ